MTRDWIMVSTSSSSKRKSTGLRYERSDESMSQLLHLRLASCLTDLPEKLRVAQLFTKFPAFYRILKFITVLAEARTCPYIEADEYSSHPETHLFKRPS